MLVTHNSLNGQHLTTAFCLRVEDSKQRRLSREEARAGTEMEITSYGIPITPVTSFKYLGGVLSNEDNDWPEVVRNLWRAWQKWERLTRVLSRGGADARTSGQIYLSVVQSFMLYSSETWVITPRMERFWGGFHHRVACRMTERQPRREWDGF